MNGIAGNKRIMPPTGVIIAQSHLEETRHSPSRQDVHRMFDRIARRYDILNRLLSFGQDILWRKKLAKILNKDKAETVLDLATGTADVLLSVHKYNQAMRLGVGIDLAAEMLQVGRYKLERANLSGKTLLLRAVVLSVPIADNSFDAVTISFGIRNVVDVPKALKEMWRVLKTGGKALILEFALPPNPLLRRIFLIYLHSFIPFIGGMVSGNNRAYKYFHETVETFPYGEEFVQLMKDAGFKEVKMHRLTFGVAIIYEGVK